MFSESYRIILQNFDTCLVYTAHLSRCSFCLRPTVFALNFNKRRTEVSVSWKIDKMFGRSQFGKQICSSTNSEISCGSYFFGSKVLKFIKNSDILNKHCVWFFDKISANNEPSSEMSSHVSIIHCQLNYSWRFLNKQKAKNNLYTSFLTMRVIVESKNRLMDIIPNHLDRWQFNFRLIFDLQLLFVTPRRSWVYLIGFYYKFRFHKNIDVSDMSPLHV